MRTVAVASYLYDNTGHLRTVWDPRISPALKTRYVYDASGRLMTLTPPGQNGWTLAYDNVGRLAHVARTDPVNGLAVGAIAYGLPITGPAAPVDLSLTVTATWAQTVDLPRVGTAVFPASHIPPRNGSSGLYEPNSTDWRYAELTYLDVNGRAVNTASFGAGAWRLNATRWDTSGNVTWQLDAGNRAEALAPTAATDPYVAARTTSPERADLLATVSTYSADGADLLTSTGPTHPVVLQTGVVASSRTRTTNLYDQGKPNAEDYHLLTTSTAEPVVIDGSGSAGAEDQRITVNAYDPIDGAPSTGPTSGWVLRRPTIVKIVFPGTTPNIERKVQFDSAGRPVETRMPGASGSTPGKTTYRYFTAAADASYPTCGLHPEWAGLPCKVFPKGQPTEGPPIPVKNFTYTMYGQPDVVTERRQATGSLVRTSNTDYDTAGRVTVSTVTTTSEAPSSPLPSFTAGYDTATGSPASLGDGTRTIVVSYDAIGRLVSYTDADASTTQTGYDIDGRVVTVNDGKGTATYTWDGTDALGREEHRGLVTSIDTGMGAAPDVFTGAYDARGALIQQNLPNGLVTTSAFDNAGNTTRLTYAKGGSTWLEFTARPSAHGETRYATGAGGSAQTYAYDRAGRLIRVDDTFQGACTVRSYTFDLNSNRTQLNSYADNGDGTCTTGTTPVVETHSYDTADRISDTGHSYDQLGRTLTLPGVQVAGATDLTVAYFGNDMVATLTQGSASKTFSLDPDGRVRVVNDVGGPRPGTVTNHYSNGTDRPSWIAEHDGTWTRNVAGISGGLAAIQRSDGTVDLQLSNLHGDVVATVPDDTGALGVSAYFEQTEYGLPRAENSTDPIRYGWLGGEQRSSDALAGIILMGVRLYNPTTGRFLSVDPVPGGNENAYVYPVDPIRQVDLSGRFATSRSYDLFFLVAHTRHSLAWVFGQLTRGHWDAIFPHDGCGSYLTAGENCYLRAFGNPFIGGPIHVSWVANGVIRLNARPGHPEYPGYIRFTFTMCGGSYQQLYLYVHAHTNSPLMWPDRAWQSWKWFAYISWWKFSANLRNFLT
jgi:RHS repeat-associated protein